jgi:hypothetical protein
MIESDLLFAPSGFFGDRGPLRRRRPVSRDVDALPLEHARDETAPAADLDSRASQTLEGFDAGSIDEPDACQIETHGAAGSKKSGAFALQQIGPFLDDAPFELERCPRA